jgi:hypothetical protein
MQNNAQSQAHPADLQHMQALDIVCTTGHALMAMLRRLPEEMARRRVGLIALDSVAMLARLEYGSDQVMTRQKMLAEQASLLKQLAEQFDIPVVLTNQVSGGGAASGTPGAQRAALGLVWAHAVSTRLVLDHQQNTRWLQVRFALSRACAIPSASSPVHRNLALDHLHS